MTFKVGDIVKFKDQPGQNLYEGYLLRVTGLGQSHLAFELRRGMCMPTVTYVTVRTGVFDNIGLHIGSSYFTYSNNVELVPNLTSLEEAVYGT